MTLLGHFQSVAVAAEPTLCRCQAPPRGGLVDFYLLKTQWFISVDQEKRVFKSGLQVERGYVTGPEASQPWGLRPDWDWHRLVRQCRAGSILKKELERLLKREGFVAAAIGESAGTEFTGRNFPSIRRLREALAALPGHQWGGFQLCYPMPEAEVRACSGYELAKAVFCVFAEVVPAMNCCLQVPLTVHAD